MKPWTEKRKRVIIGMVMFFCFIDLVYTLGFIFQLSNTIGLSPVLTTFVLHYCWLPAILCIVLAYHVLTKVYKYEEVKK